MAFKQASAPTDVPNVPKYKFKVGRVNCAVWRNGEFFKTTFSVSYQNADQSWGETDSFSKNDLPALSSAADYALMLILGDERKD